MSLQLRQVLFRGRERAITLDWEVADGALCTIVAGPATGKTGAALSIVGASEPHCGVRIDERDVVTSHERARVLALVPSDPYLAFSLVGDSVRDEIALGFRFLGLTEDRGLIDTLTADLAIEHLLDRDPMSLSGGEAVRVALMLALIKRPRVIVLDDIWDSVDPHAEAGVRRFLSTWCGTSRGIVLDLRRESHRDVEGPILSIEPTTAAPLEEVNPTTFARELHGATRLDSLSAQYRGNDSFVLGPINVQVPRGGAIALVGPNGAGKTTCLRAVAGVTPSRTGDVFIGDTKLTASTPLPERAKYSQYVFQNPDDQLHLRSVREELAVAAVRFNRDLGDVSAVATTLGLESCLDESPLDQPRCVRRLVTVGTAFCAGAPVVLLDEPTTGLDRRQAASVARLIRSHTQRGGTAIFVSHDQLFVEQTATTIWHLEAGRITRVQEVTPVESAPAL